MSGAFRGGPMQLSSVSGSELPYAFLSFTFALTSILNSCKKNDRQIQAFSNIHYENNPQRNARRSFNQVGFRHPVAYTSLPPTQAPSPVRTVSAEFDVVAEDTLSAHQTTRNPPFYFF